MEAITSTLAARIYTMQIEPSGSLSPPGASTQLEVYQAPDRVSLDLGGPLETVVVGDRLFYPTGLRTWVEQPTPSATFAHDEATHYLRALSGIGAVKGSHGELSGVVPALPSNQDPEGLPVRVRVRIRDGLVVEEVFTPPPSTVWHGAFRVVYSNIGSSPVVTSPPRNTVTPARRCGDDYVSPDVQCGTS
jgi:hypothetical protein